VLDISSLSVSELENKRELYKAFADMAFVGTDTVDLYRTWSEQLRLIDLEIMERILLSKEF